MHPLSRLLATVTVTVGFAVPFLCPASLFPPAAPGKALPPHLSVQHLFVTVLTKSGPALAGLLRLPSLHFLINCVSQLALQAFFIADLIKLNIIYYIIEQVGCNRYQLASRHIQPRVALNHPPHLIKPEEYAATNGEARADKSSLIFAVLHIVYLTIYILYYLTTGFEVVADETASRKGICITGARLQLKKVSSSVLMRA